MAMLLNVQPLQTRKMSERGQFGRGGASEIKRLQFREPSQRGKVRNRGAEEDQ